MFFIEPDGQVRSDLINQFAPVAQVDAGTTDVWRKMNDAKLFNTGSYAQVFL